ncbi:hypothetical protein DUNSADRAFT_18432 [Dunaliella salina]|uniref:Secreted protein n=1 Tax=Dunaliella salina TaxID=3046 RepID=A0ABQ7GZ57_DUNSA|nr:hypothetical protein DUNSADRAFT_18432 [Dunaliella salina]|eukprot:KAF5839889.1 hypothetical protein DUNSADRAFT_18432 [Dunaliella salina]
MPPFLISAHLHLLFNLLLLQVCLFLWCREIFPIEIIKIGKIESFMQVVNTWVKPLYPYPNEEGIRFLRGSHPLKRMNRLNHTERNFFFF